MQYKVGQIWIRHFHKGDQLIEITHVHTNWVEYNNINKGIHSNTFHKHTLIKNTYISPKLTPAIKILYMKGTSNVSTT